jgi:N-acyl amino acid synthase of PEP-CTERM/exosortase system
MFPFELLNLSQGFKRYFDVAPAVSDDLQDQAYGIRHRVYCEELGFEPVREDRRERDPYDARAMHVLVRSTKVDRFVACARLVRVDPDDPSSLLPVERTCAHTIDRSIVDPAKLPRDSIAEISRLAIVPEFRRRNGEQHAAIAVSEADFGKVDLPRFPYIQVSLYLGAIALAKELGVETIFVLTEPRLASHLWKLGVRIRRIGGPVEHRGERVPSTMTVSSIEANLPRSVRPLWELIGEQIRAGFERRGATLH